VIYKSIKSCPESQRVNTRIVDGYNVNGAFGVRNEQVLTKRGRLFFCDDGTYVYYTPSEWAPL
jgi:hypothetical protein